MKRIIVVVVILVLAVTVALFLVTYRRPAPQAAALLPDTTLLFANIPDFPKTRDNFRQTQVYQLWQEPEMQAFLEKPLQALRQTFQSESHSPLQDLFEGELLGLLQGEVFVAVTQVTAIPNLRVGLVFGANVKDRAILARAALAHAEQSIRANNPAATTTTKEYLGVKYSLWQLNDKVQICHAFFKSLVVFTLDENQMRDVISRATGNAPADSRPLSASDRYREILRQMPEPHDFVAYLNIEQLLGIFGPFLALSPQTAGLFQRFAGLQAAATSMTFANGSVQDVSLVQYAGGTHKPSPATSQRTLAATATATSFYSVRSVDLAAVYRQMMDSIAQSKDPRFVGPAGQFDRKLTQAGVRIADDVLAKLGPETALVAIWRDGARLPDVALVAELKDAATTRPKLDLVMNAIREALATTNQPTEWDNTPLDGETLRTVHLGANVVSPSYVATDNFFILALSADYARSLVSQLKTGKSTLTASPDYLQAMQRLPGKSASYTYCDLRTVLTPLYALARANFTMAATNQFVQIDQLPLPATLARHLAPFASATMDTETRQTTTTFSPMGKPLTVVLGLAATLGAAQPLLAQLQPSVIPGLPTMSLDKVAPTSPHKSPTAASQTPAP